jgi:LmbE family N-acetylglucosaminyl deacetylase
MSPDTVGDLGTILGVWGHPDDEAYLSAGLMAQAVDAGRRVVCVTATAGEAGFAADDARSAEVRMALRKAEMAASLAELGVAEHRWLGYGDGRCAEVSDEQAVEVIAGIIAEVRPDTVLTFGPDGATGHPDHIAVSRWSTLACAAASSPPRLLYSTKSPEWNAMFFSVVPAGQVMMVDGRWPEEIPTGQLAVWLTCAGELLDRKVRALRAQQSQIEPLVTQYGVNWFRQITAEEFFREPLDTDSFG